MSFKSLFNTRTTEDYEDNHLFVNHLAMHSLEADVPIADILDSMTIDNNALRHHERQLSIVAWKDATYTAKGIFDQLDICTAMLDLLTELTNMDVPFEIAEQTVLRTTFRRFAVAWEQGISPVEISERVNLGSVFEEVCVQFEQFGQFLTTHTDEEISEMLDDLANAGIHIPVPHSRDEAMDNYFAITQSLTESAPYYDFD